MHSSGPNAALFSDASINRIFNQLFNRYYELKSEYYQCLLSNKTKNERQLLKYNQEILPGHVFSLNDQCQILSGNTTVAACINNNEKLCQNIYCFYPVKNDCYRERYEVMGIYYTCLSFIVF